MKISLEILGFSFAKKDAIIISKTKKEVFKYKGSELIKDKSEGFILLKGSKICREKPRSYVYQGVSDIRDDLIKKNKVDSNFVLQEDFYWKTPSLLASLVSGRSKNGWDSWKNSEGVSLSEYRVKK